jgi:hypothetical protein
MTEKRQKQSKAKDLNARIHTDPFFATLKSVLHDLDQGDKPPDTPKSKIKSTNGTRFARVFSKAKAHDS